MIENKEHPVQEPGTASPSRKVSVMSWPSTKLGRLAVGVTVLGWLLPFMTIFINIMLTSQSTGEPQGLNAFNTLVFLCEIAGGILGTIAVWKKQERSLLVWLVILLGAGALILVVMDIVQAFL